MEISPSSNLQAWFYIIFSQIIIQLPLIAVLIAGIVFSFTKSHNHPKIGFWSGLGFGILLFIHLVFPIITILIPYFARGNSQQDISIYFSVIGVLSALISAIAFFLLLRAIWADRR